MFALPIGSSQCSRLARLALGLALLGACSLGQRTTPPQPPQPPPQPPVAAQVPPQPPPPPVVALLVPLSGPHAAVGRDILDAVQMALFDVADEQTALLVRDTGGTVDGAVAAMRDVLARNAGLVLGPLFAASARAVAPIARERGVPVLSFSNDSAVAESGVFVLGFRPEEQVDRVLGHAAGQGLRRIALLAPDDVYGARVVSAWRAALQRHRLDLTAPHALLPADERGIEAAVRELADYDARRAELERQKRELKARDDEIARATLAQLATRDTFGPPPFDALLIAEGGLRLRSIAALAAYYDVTPPAVRFLGTARWIEEDPAIAEVEVLHGSWVAAPDPESLARFRARFETVYGREPGPLAALGFDAGALAFVLARSKPPFPVADLTAPEGFSGYTGILRLRPDGLAEHGLAILELGPDGPRVVDPAPAAFPAGFAALPAALQGSSAVSSQKRVIASAAR